MLKRTRKCWRAVMNLHNTVKQLIIVWTLMGFFSGLSGKDPLSALTIQSLFLFIFYAREQWKLENEKIQTDTEDIRSLNVRRKQGGIYIRLVNKPVINSNKLTNEHLKFRTAKFLKPTFFSISFSDWTSIMDIRFLSPVPVVTCLSSPVVFSKFSARIWFTEKHGQLDKMTGWY